MRHKVISSLFLASILLFSTISFGTMNQASAQAIPDWIKKNADWWEKGLITDRDFATGLGYMIKEKIIHVENVEIDPQGSIVIDENISIPKWIHNNARWWADGAISDDDFRSGIQFMVKEEIISFKERPVEILTSDVPGWARNFFEAGDEFGYGEDVGSPSGQISRGDFMILATQIDLEKVVESNAKILAAIETIFEWSLVRNNYVEKNLDDMIDDAWSEYNDTKDEKNMNDAVGLENNLFEAKENGKSILTDLKQAQSNLEQFFDDAQKAGFDKFYLEKNANTELCPQDVNNVKTDKDFDDAKERIEDCKKQIDREFDSLTLEWLQPRWSGYEFSGFFLVTDSLCEKELDELLSLCRTIDFFDFDDLKSEMIQSEYDNFENILGTGKVNVVTGGETQVEPQPSEEEPLTAEEVQLARGPIVIINSNITCIDRQVSHYFVLEWADGVGVDIGFNKSPPDKAEILLDGEKWWGGSSWENSVITGTDDINADGPHIIYLKSVTVNGILYDLSSDPNAKLSVTIPCTFVTLDATVLAIGDQHYPISQFTEWRWVGECDDQWHYHTPIGHATSLDTTTGIADLDSGNCGFGKTLEMFVLIVPITSQDKDAFKAMTGYDPTISSAQYGGDGP